MGGDGIHIAAGQHCILHAAVFDAEHIHRLRDARVGAAEKDLLRLAGALHGDGLSGKVAECPDAAVGIHRSHLTAHHVRPRPAVHLFAAIHGKAAPDAVDGTAFHQSCFLFPIDRFKPGSIPHAAERLGGDLHIDPGGNAVIVQIDIRWIGVASHNDLCKTVVFHFLSSAGSQTAYGSSCRQQRASVQECTA